MENKESSTPHKECQLRLSAKAEHIRGVAFCDPVGLLKLKARGSRTEQYAVYPLTTIQNTAYQGRLRARATRLRPGWANTSPVSPSRRKRVPAVWQGHHAGMV